jgi:hypothetical protein
MRVTRLGLAVTAASLLIHTGLSAGQVIQYQIRARAA